MNAVMGDGFPHTQMIKPLSISRGNYLRNGCSSAVQNSSGLRVKAFSRDMEVREVGWFERSRVSLLTQLNLLRLM